MNSNEATNHDHEILHLLSMLVDDDGILVTHDEILGEDVKADHVIAGKGFEIELQNPSCKYRFALLLVADAETAHQQKIKTDVARLIVSESISGLRRMLCEVFGQDKVMAGVEYLKQRNGDVP